MSLPPVPGLEARFRWLGPLEIILNDSLNGFPRYAVATIGAWRSTADVEPISEANTAREGERARFTQRVGKTITFEGKTQGQTMDDLRSAEDLLTAAFWDTTVEYVMSVEVRNGGSWEPVFTFGARALSVDGVEQQDASPMRESLGYERPFVITMRMGDPRLFSVDDASFVTGSFSSTTVGAIPPFIPPITWSAGGVAAEADIYNEGTAPADPIFTISGPVDGPELHNDTLDRYLAFPGISLSLGETLAINFKQRTVVRNGILDHRKYLEGDWWDRGVPGLAPLTTNNIRLVGTTLGVGAQADITFKPARY